jgi:hypothetical protein
MCQRLPHGTCVGAYRIAMVNQGRVNTRGNHGAAKRWHYRESSARREDFDA